MRLLLDTHIWIWIYTAPENLTSDVAKEMTNPNSERYVSPVSIWEIAVLLEKRRIDLRGDFGEWFKKSVKELVLLEAPLNWNVAHELKFTMLSHRDPADRFLVATAKVFDLTLVTADEKLMSVPGMKVMPNR
ncbi:MAG TPA: type II toxin-antitoxin system VapC family toxin [Candidatus Acidoferrum sp.]|nr:type II toxin-antitoxin system VapC family toxin [Candidatus Acidoferrum sp.]